MPQPHFPQVLYFSSHILYFSRISYSENTLRIYSNHLYLPFYFYTHSSMHNLKLMYHKIFYHFLKSSLLLIRFEGKNIHSVLKPLANLILGCLSLALLLAPFSIPDSFSSAITLAIRNIKKWLIGQYFCNEALKSSLSYNEPCQTECRWNEGNYLRRWGCTS